MDLVNETDFLELYRKLEFSPDGGLLELKRAYRRRVSLLHPDRRAGGPLDVRAAEILKRITAQYAAAVEFHRRHGRLPGAAFPSKPVSADSFAQIPGAIRVDQREHRRPVPSVESRGARSRWLILLAAVALGVLLWNIYAERATATAGSSNDAG